jgi:hypothetical protein
MLSISSKITTEKIMRRYLWPALALAGMLLGGCASVVKNDVVAFHDWPTDLQDKSYVFDPKPEQKEDLEYQSYQGLVRGELQRLGFMPALSAQRANLKVALDYGIEAREVKVLQPVYADPYWPYYGPYGAHWRGYYGPFYDPFWYPGPVLTGYQENQYQVFQRRLHIQIARKDGKKLYEVTVDSRGGNGSLAFAMPYMVRAAFQDFPGKSGVPHRVNLKIEEGKQ